MSFTTADLLVEHLSNDPLMMLMVACSLAIVALSAERFLFLVRMWFAIGRAQARVVGAARRGPLDEARRGAEGLASPVREVFLGGLDRALGKVRGDAAKCMTREQRRAAGRFRAMLWVLGTMGALMPFVGLLGTVIGVMASFRAIGDSGQGGFAVVSAGISQALIATALGLFVALEAVVLFNFLQNFAAKLSRDLQLLVDELVELLSVRRAEDAGNAAG